MARRNYAVDAIGSVIGTCINDTLENKYAYGPFGSVLATTGAAADPAFKWIGTPGYRNTDQRCSEVYVRARTYSRQLARWVTVDPLWPDEAPYTYVDQKPLTLTDASGRSSVECPAPVRKVVEFQWFKHVAEGSPCGQEDACDWVVSLSGTVSYSAHVTVYPEDSNAISFLKTKYECSLSGEAGWQKYFNYHAKSCPGTSKCGGDGKLHGYNMHGSGQRSSYWSTTATIDILQNPLLRGVVKLIVTSRARNSFKMRCSYRVCSGRNKTPPSLPTVDPGSQPLPVYPYPIPANT